MSRRRKVNAPDCGPTTPAPARYCPAAPAGAYNDEEDDVVVVVVMMVEEDREGASRRGGGSVRKDNHNERRQKDNVTCLPESCVAT